MRGGRRGVAFGGARASRHAEDAAGHRALQRRETGGVAKALRLIVGDETRKPAFVAAIQSYFPDLDPNQLAPGYAGVRPKLAPAGSAAQDFVIQSAAQHGVPNLIHLYGIESPGLTASLAIADEVQRLLAAGAQPARRV